VAFGIKVIALFNKTSPIIKYTKKIFNRKLNLKIFIALLAPKLAKFLKLAIFDREVFLIRRIDSTVCFLIIGSYDTTAISYAIYNLACHPEAQDKLYEEAKTLFSSDASSLLI
jgi:hypothetical protein